MFKFLNPSIWAGVIFGFLILFFLFTLVLPAFLFVVWWKRIPNDFCLGFHLLRVFVILWDNIMNKIDEWEKMD